MGRPCVYAVLTPRSWAVEDREWLARHVDRRQAPQLTVPGPDDPFPPSVVPDEVVTHEVVRPDLVSVQAAALAAHETQVRVLDGYYALSNDVAARLPGREGFAQVDLAHRAAARGRGSVTGAGSRRGLLDAAGARA